MTLVAERRGESELGKSTYSQPINPLLLRGLVLSLTITLAMPLRTRLPEAWGEDNWIYAINETWLTGSDFGSDVVFTYGPWGFLTWPLALDRGMVVLAALFCAIAIASFWAIISHWMVTAFGETRGLLSASVLTLVCNRLASPSWLLLLAIAAWVMSQALTGRRYDRRTLALAVSLSALLMQIKFSEGLTALSLVGLLVLSRRSFGHALVAAPTLVLASLAWWLLSGQGITAMLKWFQGAIEIASGYNEAMRMTLPESAMLEALGVICVFTLLLGGWLGRKCVAKWPIPYFAVTAWFLFLTAKQGFTLSDSGHAAQFYLATAVSAIVGLSAGRAALGRIVTVGIACAAAAVSVVGSNVPYDADARSWVRGVRLLVSESNLQAGLEHHRAELRKSWNIPDSMVQVINADPGPVLVDPQGAVAAWAHGWERVKLPTIVPYSGYTPHLDKINARTVFQGGTRYVLRQLHVFDYRYPLWDSPRYNMTLLCNFELRLQADHWALFERVAPRCQERDILARYRITGGESVTLPPVSSDEVLMVSYQPAASGIGSRIADALGRPDEFVVALDGRPIRVPRAHAPGPLIVRLPSSEIWPAEGWARPEFRSFSGPVDGIVELTRMNLRS